jgi:hypothetical protein
LPGAGVLEGASASVPASVGAVIGGNRLFMPTMWGAGVMEGAAAVLAGIGGRGPLMPTMGPTGEGSAMGRDPPKMECPGEGAPIRPTSTSAVLVAARAPVEVVGVRSGVRMGVRDRGSLLAPPDPRNASNKRDGLYEMGPKLKPPTFVVEGGAESSSTFSAGLGLPNIEPVYAGWGTGR